MNIYGQVGVPSQPWFQTENSTTAVGRNFIRDYNIIVQYYTIVDGMEEKELSAAE